VTNKKEREIKNDHHAKDVQQGMPMYNSYQDNDHHAKCS